MEFDFTEEQLLIQKTARDFAKNELAPKAQERDEQGTFPTEELHDLAELGLMGVNVPEVYGGTEAGGDGLLVGHHRAGQGGAPPPPWRWR